MDKYSELQMKCKDFDIFCIINNKPIHIATLGSIIPEELNHIQRITESINDVCSIQPFTNAVLNEEKIKKYVSIEEYSFLDNYNKDQIEKKASKLPGFREFQATVPLFIKLFSWYFMEMARRGFYSFAHVGNEDADFYFLVAWPEHTNQEFIEKHAGCSFVIDGIDLGQPQNIEIVHFNSMQKVNDNNG